jgi:tetratricopeptide (TPR) repeat protein
MASNPQYAVRSNELAVQNIKAQLGSEHPRTLSSMFELGMALHRDGRIEKALCIFQQLLPLRDKVLGPHHVDSISTLDAICEELYNLGKYAPCLSSLNQEMQRCEEAFGEQNEKTIRLLVDIGHITKELGKLEDASSAFSMALERSKTGLGARHLLTLAISNDMRGLEKPRLPDLDEAKGLLQQAGLHVNNNPFSTMRSITSLEFLTMSDLRVCMSVGYEASNALSLRLGPINGRRMPSAPSDIPTYYNDPGKITLSRVSSQGQPDNSFGSLIKRSIGILPKRILYRDPRTKESLEKHVTFLKSVKSLEELLETKESPVWFFQTRQSFLEQTTMQRWDPTSLGKYVLLPTVEGFVNPEDCIFISHYWQTRQHPDPEGRDLRQLQQLLNDGFWSKASYVWVDWTCLPQWERTPCQQLYFSRVLQSIPRLVRDCSFVAHFSNFQPRLWVLFEVAAFTFHRPESVGLPCTDTFQTHLFEMQGQGPRLVLDKYGYKCTNKADREWVITWLEVLLVLRQSVPSIHTRCQILNAIDNIGVRSCIHQQAHVEIDKERGTIQIHGETHHFKPLPVENGPSCHGSAICIMGDHDVRLKRALQRADESPDIAGVGEIGREYDLSGDYAIAEALHQRAIKKGKDEVALYDLASNLEKQKQYKEAERHYRELKKRIDEPGEIQQKLVAMQTQSARFVLYERWKQLPLEATLRLKQFKVDPRHQRLPEKPLSRKGLNRSWLQRLDQRVWKCEDVSVLKGMEEQALEFEEQRLFSEAQEVHWDLLGRRKKLLGSCHIDTRRSISGLARACQLAGKLTEAHVLYNLGVTICDYTLGPWHPESRAALANLAMAVLLQKKLGVARSYYRQLLERTLAVAEWDNPETKLPKLCLRALFSDVEMRIVQAGEETRVNLYAGMPGGEEAADNSTPFSMLRTGSFDGRGNGTQVRKRIVTILDLEKARQLSTRYIVAQ